MAKYLRTSLLEPSPLSGNFVIRWLLRIDKVIYLHSRD
jgi:hypothetical protein